MMKTRKDFSIRNYISVIFFLSLSAWMMAACAGRQIEPTAETSREAVEYEDEWVLAYGSDFSREPLAPEWILTAGNAVVAEGVLVLRAAVGHAQVILKDPSFLSPSTRMEFQAYIPTYAEPSDLSPFLNSNNKGCEGSYLFQLGAEGNQVNRLRRIGEVVKDAEKAAFSLETDHLYRIVVENDQGVIRCEIDGTSVMEWDDLSFLSGPEHCHVGFYTWQSEIHLDNVKIFHKLPR